MFWIRSKSQLCQRSVIVLLPACVHLIHVSPFKSLLHLVTLMLNLFYDTVIPCIEYLSLNSNKNEKKYPLHIYYNFMSSVFFLLQNQLFQCVRSLAEKAEQCSFQASPVSPQQAVKIINVTAESQMSGTSFQLSVFLECQSDIKVVT